MGRKKSPSILVAVPPGTTKELAKTDFGNANARVVAYGDVAGQKPDALIIDQRYPQGTLLGESKVLAGIEVLMQHLTSAGGLIISLGCPGHEPNELDEAESALQDEAINKQVNTQPLLPVPIPFQILESNIPYAQIQLTLDPRSVWPRLFAKGVRATFHIKVTPEGKPGYGRVDIAGAPYRCRLLASTKSTDLVLAGEVEYGKARITLLPEFDFPRIDIIKILVEYAAAEAHAISADTATVPVLSIHGADIEYYGVPLPLTKLPSKILRFLANHPEQDNDHTVLLKAAPFRAQTSAAVRSQTTIINKAVVAAAGKVHPTRRAEARLKAKDFISNASKTIRLHVSGADIVFG